jgi:hypothetical protein
MLWAFPAATYPDACLPPFAQAQADFQARLSSEGARRADGDTAEAVGRLRKAGSYSLTDLAEDDDDDGGNEEDAQGKARGAVANWRADWAPSDTGGEGLEAGDGVAGAGAGAAGAGAGSQKISRFCVECGAPLAALPAKAKFCAECGEPLAVAILLLLWGSFAAASPGDSGDIGIGDGGRP